MSRVSRRPLAEVKGQKLGEALDFIFTNPPYSNGFDPLAVSRFVLDRLPILTSLTKPQAKRLREAFDDHVAGLSAYRARLDPVRDPDASFDPSNPDTVGRLVVIALLAQERVPLAQIRPTYGSGVYAIYYTGTHAAYDEIRGTETPIYVGKADPEIPNAATPREQGPRLFRRLVDHRDAISEVEAHAEAQGEEESLRVQDFECRRLVCATNAQLVAERHLVGAFRPAWNHEVKVCWGISKHGDSADTRRNKKAPWDVLHPGRQWAAGSPVRVGMTADTVRAALARHFSAHPPVRDEEAVMQLMLDAFRQVGRASEEESEAAEEVEAAESALRQGDDGGPQARLDLEAPR